MFENVDDGRTTDRRRVVTIAHFGSGELKIYIQPRNWNNLISYQVIAPPESLGPSPTSNMLSTNLATLRRIQLSRTRKQTMEMR